MVRILGKASSINVRKVLWTCVELGIGFEREDWGAGFQSTAQPEFLALNPNAMVPVIVDGDTVLWESNTICRYLAARYGDAQLASPLLPPEPSQLDTPELIAAFQARLQAQLEAEGKKGTVKVRRDATRSE